MPLGWVRQIKRVLTKVAGFIHYVHARILSLYFGTTNVSKWIVPYVQNLRFKRNLDVGARMKRISSTTIIGCVAQNCICQRPVQLVLPLQRVITIVRRLHKENGQIANESHVPTHNTVNTNHSALASFLIHTRECVHQARQVLRHSARCHVRDFTRVSDQLNQIMYRECDSNVTFLVEYWIVGRVRFENGTTVHPDTIRLNSNIKYNYTCEPLPCSKQRGWTGEFMPNCTYTPFCPDGFPGNYPYCNKYATSSTALPTVRTTTTTRTTAQPIVRTATRGNVRLKGRLDSRISTDSSLPSYRNSNRNNLV